MASPSFPLWIGPSTPLFNHEYFQLLSQALNDDGIICNQGEAMLKLTIGSLFVCLFCFSLSRECRCHLQLLPSFTILAYFIVLPGLCSVIRGEFLIKSPKSPTNKSNLSPIYNYIFRFLAETKKGMLVRLLCTIKCGIWESFRRWLISHIYAIWATSR